MQPATRQRLVPRVALCADAKRCIVTNLHGGGGDDIRLARFEYDAQRLCPANMGDKFDSILQNTPFGVSGYIFHGLEKIHYTTGCVPNYLKHSAFHKTATTENNSHRALQAFICRRAHYRRTAVYAVLPISGRINYVIRRGQINSFNKGDCLRAVTGLTYFSSRACPPSNICNKSPLCLPTVVQTSQADRREY